MMKTQILQLTAQGRMPRARTAGYVLFTCLVFVSALTLIGATLAAVVRPEMRAAAFHRQNRDAFYHAEAVVQHTLASINEGLRAGTLDVSGEVVALDFELPEGVHGEVVTELQCLANGVWYRFTATGYSGRAKSVFEVTVRRPSLLAAGLFGDAEVDLKPHYEVFSYNSSVTPNPQRADSTGEASVGLNSFLKIGPGVYIDGQFILGAHVDGTVPAVPEGYVYQELGRFDPDPLGIEGGMLAEAFTHYSDPGNNDNEAAGIVNNMVKVPNHSSITLTGGRYYLKSLDLSPGATLNIETTPGDPVIIYMDGDFGVHPNSRINTGPGQRPSDFFIFSRSSNEIKILPNGDFQGMVYAPFADLQVQPDGQVYGVFWAGSSTIQPGGNLFIDTSLLNRFPASYVVVEQWNQIL